MIQKAPPGIATFDSASAFLQALALCLHGQGFPSLGKTGVLPRIGHLANLLPQRLRELAFASGGPGEAVSPSRLAEVDAEQIAEWIAGLYPQRRYPAVMIGSSNGALAHAGAAMGIPWLPQTFLCLVRQRHPDPDDAGAAMESGAKAGRALLERNPQVTVHQMHDPNQDRRMTPWVSYFRLKYIKLPAAYRRFLAERLEPGGTVYVVECGSVWPLTRLSDRHFFQFGAAGGATRAEYFESSDRVAELFRQLGKDRRRWNPPAPDCTGPEAEWGFEPRLRPELEDVARQLGFRTMRLALDNPEEVSAPVADFFRAHNAERGIEARRLIVPSFILHDPYWTLRTGSVPFWMVFNAEESLRRIRDYIRHAGPFDQIGMMLFSNGTEAVGQASIEDCRSLFPLARERGFFLGVDEQAYPRDFAALKNYHLALKSLKPHLPMPEPAGRDLFERVLEHSGAARLDEEEKGGSPAECLRESRT